MEERLSPAGWKPRSQLQEGLKQTPAAALIPASLPRPLPRPSAEKRTGTSWEEEKEDG